MTLADRTILITGATSGIGRCLAALLHRRGNAVVAIGRDAAKLSALADALPGLRVHACDLSRRAEVVATMRAVLAEAPDISVIVNNAGVQHTPPFTSSDFIFDTIETELATNLAAPMWIAAMALPTLSRRDDGGMIVNIGSSLAFYPKRESAVYCATKAGLHNFSQGLRHQLEGTEVTVAEVLLPLVDTAMTADRGRDKIPPEAAARAIVAGIEAGREEIYVGKARLLPLLLRVAPGLVRRLLKNA